MKEEILRLDHVTMERGGEWCLDDVNLYILKGEIVGFIASEAKGKNELIQLLSQNLPISHGRVYLDGRLVNSYAGSDMAYNKVYAIGQKSGLVPDLTVADNIFVMRRGFKKMVINRRVLGEQVRRLFGELGLDVDPGRTIDRLKPMERCMVELVRAKLMGCGLIILNDFDNFLSNEDIQRIRSVMDTFCSLGIAFLYVGNHHEDVFRMSHRALLFAGGQVIKVFARDEMDNRHIAPYITSFGLSGHGSHEREGQVTLELMDLRYRHLKGLSLSVRQGECVAVLDVDNNVIEDLVEVIGEGAIPDGGDIFLGHKPYTPEMSRRSLLHGIGFIGDDPVRTQVFRDLTYMENLTFLLDRKLECSIVKKGYYASVEREYGPLVGEAITCTDVSGATQEDLYRMVYYRLHLYNPDVVVCVSPFSYGDMHCRNVVLELIQQLKEKGIAVILLLVNISDSMQVADRLAVVEKGTIAREYGKDEFYLVKR